MRHRRIRLTTWVIVRRGVWVIRSVIQHTVQHTVLPAVRQSVVIPVAVRVRAVRVRAPVVLSPAAA